MRGIRGEFSAMEFIVLFYKNEYFQDKSFANDLLA